MLSRYKILPPSSRYSLVSPRTLSLAIQSLSLTHSRSFSNTHSLSYCSVCTRAAPRRASPRRGKTFSLFDDRPTDVPARRRETPGRDDSIKRFDCSSRDDCPLIENVLDPVERARREKTSSRVVPIWRWCLSNLSATVSNHA